MQLLLKALRKLKRPYKLKIVGDGYLRKKLKKYATQHSINALFLGQMAKEKIVSLYKSSLFVVAPSILEPFGFVKIEAMSCKRAVIIFNSGGHSEGVENSVNGYLIKPFDLNELAKKIEYLLENPDVALGMGQKGYEIFLSKFTIERHCQRLRKKLIELGLG